MVMTARTVSPAIRAPAGVSKVNVDDDGGAIVSAETSMSFFFRMFTSQARKSIFLLVLSQHSLYFLAVVSAVLKQPDCDQ
jgi:hypothetical protein